MAKICPVTNDKVLYLECLECDDKVCLKPAKAEICGFCAFYDDYAGECANSESEHNATFRVPEESCEKYSRTQKDKK